jgi:translation initiation factor IF-3
VFIFADRVSVRIFYFIWRCFSISKQDLLINEEIRVKEVRLVGQDGAPLGITTSADALEQAYAKNLDLVLIAPKAEPPVCKIMDYGKYKFELAKRDKEARKNQKVVSIKEIRVSPSIDNHDFETKVNHTKKFLSDGDKVKITVRFRGREVHHSALGFQLLERFKEAVSEFGAVDKPPKLEGKNMSMVVSPKGAAK